ncbi:tRNA threonylcarbamoyladenosine biosynthesis protein TsaE [Desulfacinum hydrothermale DSM 13146]|uniref:tRNA threonylcarbamoyladenosine biosynthesis protein TsaE n=1 Tax=Desulfacinum hydrothermale DSM 13146 TaxID=1121390 RepID=A0A1W1X1J1_9BACT|nr:tRNA (adenosine(37)-N6)-threonylcarbamoyltransferase complex ATPase subunit type 1 TsaE [Desulfacinum hydrothermale]SMC17836.1 tRNA threonylcarbamoyladenosine biosynthesis protein TsaE [Desulfacinum hydrothermale DSM 13146]
MKEWTITADAPEKTQELGRAVGQRLQAGDVVALWGELGAGKTFLAESIARGLGVPEEIPVPSPTFTIINEHEGRVRLYHLDLYRIGDLDELETLPWREALFGSGVAVVEWPERLGPHLPEKRLDIHIQILDVTARGFRFVCGFPEMEERFRNLAGRVPA